MIRIRLQTILGLFVVAVGLVLTFVLGLFAYVKTTTKPLHPEAENLSWVSASAPAPRWAAAVEQGRQISRGALLEQNLPALSVAVGAGGEVVWAEALGWADIEEQARVTPHTRFRIGSASTMFTAAAAGLLIEKDRLKLDEKIQTYVPSYPEKQWPVTLRQLMAHEAGVRSDAGDEEDVRSRCERTTDGLARFAAAPLLFEPGTRFHYSTYGWMLVSAAIENAAGEPFSAYMRKQIFEPLGMADTKLDSATDVSTDTAASYFPRFAADTRYGPQEPDTLDYSCFSGATAFLSTPSDMVRFGMALDSGTLLQPATVQLLEASQRLPSGDATGYGLGFDRETVTLAGAPRDLVVHDGEIRGGMVASFITFPERGVVVAVAANTSYADTAAVALRLADVFAQPVSTPVRK